MSTGLHFCRAQKKNKEPFFRVVEKREETILFRAIARGEPGSSLSFTRALLFQMSHFSDQLREQLCFLFMLSGCNSFSTVSLMTRSNCIDFSSITAIYFPSSFN